MYTKDQIQETFVRNNTSEMEVVIWDDFRGKKGLNRRSNPRARSPGLEQRVQAEFTMNTDIIATG